MRVLNTLEIDQVSGGSPKWDKISPEQRADPATDVTANLPGNRTGWCRGYGNVKDGIAKHEGTSTPCKQVPV
jgi:hypothetical protein